MCLPECVGGGGRGEGEREGEREGGRESSQRVSSVPSHILPDGTPHTQINKVACHPTLPVMVTGHEDKYIRFYDANTG